MTTTAAAHGVQGSSRYEFMTRSYVSSPPLQSSNDLDIVKKQLELLKTADPFSVVDMAIQIENERRKVQDAMSARDAAVMRLADAYVYLEQKTAMIERLQQEMRVLGSDKVDKADKGTSTPKQSHVEGASQTEDTETDATAASRSQEVARLETLVNTLREEIKTLHAEKDKGSLKEDGPLKSSRLLTVQYVSSPSSVNSMNSIFKLDDQDFDFAVVRTAPPTGEAEDIINARNKLLATIPLPEEEAPDDTLKPIMVPSPYTLHDFLATVPESLKASLTNYRALHQLTTSWCPDREEHGYFLTPVFKCSTNPRVSMAHRWSTVDLSSRLNKPTECFYNKDGVWYYAGVYKAFRLDDLTTKEWEALSDETMQSIIKETISGRKNTSPQNIYEITQLYAAGALKVACIALQCIGFNKEVYKGILEHVDKWEKDAHTREAQTPGGRWKGSTGGGREGRAGHGPMTGPLGSSVGGVGLGLGSGTVWNVNANVGSGTGASIGDLVGPMSSMGFGVRSATSNSSSLSLSSCTPSRAEVGNENVPAPTKTTTAGVSGVLGSGRGKR
ncbi:hypothetical protein K435DRAFT_789004 [Dendrothele bispora CBS 962.96]|uniref:DUF6697 domain-containing protein n=1 Tax=Dendrothele bispora (strain CBS 962.96) TaxID=1314807 RepID=A0A4S8MUH6_DENBC|nr:hypothetical protein K435DRAFT_789004 [Dendrothele bispora CBS 962.96]